MNGVDITAAEVKEDIDILRDHPDVAAVLLAVGQRPER